MACFCAQGVSDAWTAESATSGLRRICLKKSPPQKPSCVVGDLASVVYGSDVVVSDVSIAVTENALESALKMATLPSR